MAWLNYASDRPLGQIAIITCVLVATSRYFILGIEKGAHMFADVHELAFTLHGLNSTMVPAIDAAREHLVSNYVGQAAIFRIHVITTGLAWALMPLQIWKSFRKRDMQRHRNLGYLVLSCLAVGMVSSPFLARPIRELELGGGMTSEIGFYGMAVATSYCAAMGLWTVKEGRIEEHKQWMVRAYGIMWGAFFWFRIAMVILLPLMPDKYHHVFGLIANLSWMSGWIGADIALSISSKKDAALNPTLLDSAAAAKATKTA